LALLVVVFIGPSGCSVDVEPGDGGDTGLHVGEDGGSDTLGSSDTSDSTDSTSQPSTCGDSVISGTESCDDGNATSGDGCSDTCQTEDGFVCPEPGEACQTDTCGNGTLEGAETCDDANQTSGDGCDATCSTVEPGYDCQFVGQACIASACGDGIVVANEECDDGNGISLDGCSKRCKLEEGYKCPTPDAPCESTTCGDGAREGLEACDDGDTDGGDGCDASCELELGYVCPTPGQDCEPTTCGDSVVEGSEQCDDGDSDPDDGCDADCQLEAGYTCPTPGQDCEPTTCGDGAIEGLEACDDGNLSAGDGCDPLCREELIWDCTNGTCDPVCGDSVTLYPVEACDDGNLNSGDGCSAACTIEAGFECTDFQNQTPPSIDVPIVLRDFKGDDEPNGHPDFESYSCGVTQGMVEDQLGTDGKPVYTGQGNCADSAQSFYQWYHDTMDVNITVVDTITLTQRTDLDASGRTYRFADDTFFPLTDLAFGNSPGEDVNFHFTSEFRSYFEYRGGELLDFTGDDDVWVFINGHLAVDIGGLHSAVNDSVTLSDTQDSQTGQIHDPRFDIFEGGVYEVAMFHAERHRTASNYRLTLAGFLNTGQSTCDSVCGDGIVSGDEECDDGVNDGACSPECTIEGACGDGFVDTSAGEVCDDGNNNYGDGCDGMCEEEPGWVCITNINGLSECTPQG
jgi:fibro-slime domain-containing protein